MNSTIATWIIDDNYLVPGYVSIASFRKQTDIPIVIYYDGYLSEEIKMVFKNIGGNISFSMPKQKKSYEGVFSKHIQNRLIRFEIVKKHHNQVVMLIDADTAFGKGTEKMIKSIKDNEILDSEKPIVWGVVEYEYALDAWLYFKREYNLGKVYKVPLSKKLEVFAKIYGPDWKELIYTPQFNNGILAFYNCKKLTTIWEEYYLKGLANDFINPLDDQVPLAAAIASLKNKTMQWPVAFNSLGKASGDFSTYHVWAGNWKKELLQVAEAESNLSDYAKIAQEFWKDIPNEWIQLFKANLVAIPINI